MIFSVYYLEKNAKFYDQIVCFSFDLLLMEEKLTND